jgi:DNA-directed RNA polymerase beta subunit
MADDYGWQVVKKYFDYDKGYQLVKHQEESYNDFIANRIEQTIEGFNTIEVNSGYQPETDNFKYVLKVDMKRPQMSTPTIFEKDGSTKIMMPNDARQRNFTYSSMLTVDVVIRAHTWHEDRYIVETKTLNGINLGKIPIMVKSDYCILKKVPYANECRYDYGGYFIVNGNEKVVISQDRISENKTYVFTNSKISTYSYIAEVRSVHENRLGVPKITTLKLSAKPNQFGHYIRVNLHHIKHDVPLFILFRALGLGSDKEIIKYIVYDLEGNDLLVDKLCACVEESDQITNSKDALEYLSRYLNITGYSKEILNNKQHRIQITKSVLEKEFLPHVGSSLEKKALYLGVMTNRLLKCFMGLRDFDDRDSYVNKRVDTPGVLMSNLFRQYYGKMVKDMKNMIQKEINMGSWKATNKFINVISPTNIYKIIKSTIIDSGMRYALATGNWGIKNNKNKQGVAQVLNRMTYIATISHLRRLNTPIEKSGKLVQPRKLHPTQWGIICPCECFDPETPILLWNGEIKQAKDIVVGDILIDDKGDSVRVKSTCSGYKDMFEIIPDKVNFKSHTVTDNHILTLKMRNHTRNPSKSCNKYSFRWFNKDVLRYTAKTFESQEDMEKFKSTIDDVIDITIEQFLSLPKNTQKELYLFKSNGINWEHRDVVLDPYILGMWLGDGFSDGYGFATADKELLDKYIEWGKENDGTIKKGHKYKYGISSTINNTQPGINCNKTERAPLKKLLEQYNLVKNKHIPLEYLVNDRQTRLAVLAGLIDTDGNVRANGHEVRIPQGEDNYQIIYDAEFLARSLGFSCHVNDGMCSYTVNGEKRQKPYKELTITGQYLYEIPTVLPRKKLNKFDNPTSVKKCSSYLQSPFKLVKKEVQPFVGWQLKGNGRFLLGDMTVSHNTPEGSSVGLVKNMAIMTGVTIASNSTNIRELVVELGCKMFEGNIDIFSRNTCKLYVNGDLIGIVDNPKEFYDTMKLLKMKGSINVYTGVVWYPASNEIHICTEGGRCVRPLFVVRDNQTLQVELKDKSWKDLVTGSSDMDNNDSVVEFMDVEETNTSMIATTETDLKKGDKGTLVAIRYTHREIHPSTILGVLASSIPFSDHNQSPRNCYQCLSIYEKVLMADRSFKLLRDVRVGDRIYTFDPLTMCVSITNVVYHVIREEHDKKLVQIKVKSGKKIIATDDHKFMTNTGWRMVKDFNKDTLLAIYDTWGTHDPYAVDHRGNASFVEIESITKVPHMPIGDLTTESSHHCFIGGDMFMVHNSAQGKQAIGMYATNYLARYDTVGHVLQYPQKPIVRTKMSLVLNSNKMPNGINAILAIACFTGFNQEDSIIINKGAIERGLFVSTHYKTYKEQNNKNHSNGEEEFFTRPIVKGVKPFNYNKLDESGFVPEGTMVEPGDVIIGKCMPSKSGSVINYKDNSIPLKESERSYVDKNAYGDRYFINSNGDGYTFAKVRIRTDRYPVIGDKFSCYTADHEVLTDHGWIPIAQVQKSDKIASLVKDRLVYQYPSDVQEYSYEGDLFVINTNEVKLSVTPNHRMYVWESDSDYKIMTAEKLKNQNYGYRKNVDNWFENIDEYPNDDVIMKDGKIIGFRYGKIDVSIDDCILSLGLLLETDNIADEHMPDWVWYLPREKARALVELMTNGDHYTTSSSKLADDFQRLCLHAGYCANKIPYGDLWCVVLGQETPTAQGSWDYFKGKVYCCTVPEGDGIIYIRKGGCPVWCGNSRSSQKSTCGIIYHQEDMPFTRDGIVPDMIMNPHAIPSRMTMGQLIECVMGKACVNLGVYGDATPFTDLTVEEIADILESCGMERYGNEILYDPRTGLQIDCPIFIGPTYYQRLKHMTIDKVHCMDGEHEVLTDRGWKFIYEVTTDDRVLTLQDSTAVLDYPTQTHAYYYEGEVYHVFNDHVDHLVTNEHRLWINGELVRVDEVDNHKNGTVYFQNIMNDKLQIDWEHDVVRKHYEGQVYCLSVPGEVFYVRRHGKGYWTGNSRAANGPIMLLTRQPAEGRSCSRGPAGLRVGEMEVEVFWAHGTLQILKERIMECSDNYRVFTCKKCCMIATVNPEKNIYLCKACKNTTEFSEVRIPYACKLLFQEIQSMAIATRFLTE